MTTLEGLGIKRCFCSGKKLESPFFVFAVNVSALKAGKSSVARAIKKKADGDGFEIR